MVVEGGHWAVEELTTLLLADRAKKLLASMQRTPPFDCWPLSFCACWFPVCAGVRLLETPS